MPVQSHIKIAFVSNNAWSVWNFRMDVIRHLLGLGHEVLVLAPDDEFSGKLTKAGCRFIPITFNNKGENPVQDLGFYFRLRKLYKELRPDLIFHYVAKPNIYGSIAAAAVDIPSVAVVTGLGYAFDRRNLLNRIIRILYKTAFRKAAEVWFLNNEDARVFLDGKLVNIEKVKVLPGEGVDTAFFAPGVVKPDEQSPVFTFLMSSRLLKSKGVGIYADAARLLKKKNYDVRFRLIGFFEKAHPDSISQEELQRWEKEGLITYSGFSQDVRAQLAAADCFVFPSYYNEGVPRSLMEAASMELPIITSNNRGCKELVLHNTTGYLCHPQDPFDLADKMERMLLLSNTDRDRMGQQGRALVMRKFSIEKVVEEYVGTMERLRGAD